MNHGQYGYSKGCRCDDCKAGNAARVARNRARRLAEAQRLSHGTISAWGAGCRCPHCADARKIQYMLHEGGYVSNWWREFVVDTYRSARAAWEALRESAMTTVGVAGSAGGVAYYQLSEAEFRALHPAPTLKQTMIEMRSSR